MKTSRTYTMRARADQVARTRASVVDAAVELLGERLRADIRLDDVAERAGVTVPTVLRVAGSKDDLFERAFAELLSQMRQQLDAEPGDLDGAVHAWFDHYEQFGDVVVNALAAEGDPSVQPILREGRRRHRDHVERVLGGLLTVTGRARTARIDALVCASDVYTWKLLRRDLRRSRREAEKTMTLMLASILAGGS